MFECGVERSKQLPTFFESVAKTYGAAYFNAGTIVHSSEEDGVHLQADQHELLGRKIAELVREIL